MLYLLAAEEHHSNGVHLAGDINEVIWGSIAFFIVVGLLVKLAGPAVVKAFKGRTARIEAELSAARAERDAAEAALTASRADLPDTDAEAARIRAEAFETANRVKVDLVAKAQVDAEDVRNKGLSDVENYRRQAIADLTSELSRITRQSAEAIVVERLDTKTQGDLIERYITQVEQL